MKNEERKFIECSNCGHKTFFSGDDRPTNCEKCDRPMTPEDLARDIAEGKVK